MDAVLSYPTARVEGGGEEVDKQGLVLAGQFGDGVTVELQVLIEV